MGRENSLEKQIIIWTLVPTLEGQSIKLHRTKQRGYMYICICIYIYIYIYNY